MHSVAVSWLTASIHGQLQFWLNSHSIWRLMNTITKHGSVCFARHIPSKAFGSDIMTSINTRLVTLTSLKAAKYRLFLPYATCPKTYFSKSHIEHIYVIKCICAAGGAGSICTSGKAHEAVYIIPVLPSYYYAHLPKIYLLLQTLRISSPRPAYARCHKPHIITVTLILLHPCPENFHSWF